MVSKQDKIIKSERGSYELVPIPYQGTGLKVSKIHRYLVYSSREGHVIVYDPVSHKTLLDVEVSTGSLWNLDISSDESSIITGGTKNEIFHIDFLTGVILPSFTGHTSEINHCVFSSDCASIYSASDDGTVRYFDVKSHASEVLLNHERIVYAFDFSSDEQTIVSGDSSGIIKILGLSGSGVKECSSSTSVWCLKISPNNFFFVSGNSAGVLEVWTLTGELIRTLLSKHTDRLRCIDFGDNDQIFASTGNDHLVKIWNCDNWMEEVTYDLHSDWIKAVTFDRNNRTWNCISDDRFISIIPIVKPVGGIHLDVQGEVVYMKKLKHLMVFNEENIFVCDLLTGDVLNKIRNPGKIQRLCERFDGNFLVCYENSIKVLNSRTLQFLPQVIEKIDCLVLLSSSYFYKVSKKKLKAYCSSFFSLVFSVKVDDFDLTSTEIIRFYNDWTHISNMNILHVFKKSELLRSIYLKNDIIEVVQVDENLVFALQKSVTVVVIENLEIKKKIDVGNSILLSYSFSNDNVYIYNKTNVYEYSIKPFTLVNSITFHQSIKNFQVCGKYFVVIQETGLISIHQQLKETFIVKDEYSSNRSIQKN